MKAYVKSIGGDTEKVFQRIYVTDFNTAWQAALDALKYSRLDISNREAGYLQSRWTDNTNDKNMTNSLGSTDSYLKAQYRFRIHLAKGFYNGRSSVKVSVQKEQLIQRDVLEGWRPLLTDAIEEKTLLYRIARIITIKTKITAMEKEKAERALEILNTGNTGELESEKPTQRPGFEDSPDPVSVD